MEPGEAATFWFFIAKQYRKSSWISKVTWIIKNQEKSFDLQKKPSTADFTECVIFLIRALVYVLGGRVLKGHLAMARFASPVNWECTETKC